jgi:hypothetical protein
MGILNSTIINAVNPRLRRYTRAPFIAALVFLGMTGGTLALFFVHSSGCSTEINMRLEDVKDSWPSEHGYRLYEFYSEEMNTPAIASNPTPQQEMQMRSGNSGSPRNRLLSPTIVRHVHVCIYDVPHEIVTRNHHDYCTAENDATCTTSILTKSYCNLDLMVRAARRSARTMALSLAPRPRRARPPRAVRAPDPLNSRCATVAGNASDGDRRWPHVSAELGHRVDPAVGERHQRLAA